MAIPRLDRPLTRSEQLDLNQLFVSTFREKALPPGGIAELWYHVVLDFIQYTGGTIISEELRLLEALVIERGLSTEYIQTLKSLVAPADDLEVDDQFVVLMSASGLLREQALRFVLGQV